ncbi:MAG: hypothetical protein FVQ82_04695 [Planctomycetes bacterium]|nr:hypothetical protein [Planctomycetota bacterium]
MRVAVLVFGILIVLEGILFLVKPLLYSKVVAFFARGRLMYISALLKIAVGVFLFVAVMSCDRKLIIIILGLIASGTGVTMLGMHKVKLKRMYEWWSLRPKFIIRILAILAIAVGGLIIYAAGMPK